MAIRKFDVFKLHFTTPLHIGDVRDDYGISLKTVSSDTMYAALISCLAKIGKEIPSNGDLGCTISSLFPFYEKDNECVYFFPKPLKQEHSDSETAVEERKKIKKISWIDSDFFSKILNGEQLFSEKSIEDSIKSLKGDFMTNKDIDKDFIVSQVSARVNVSRTGEDAVPFYMDRIYFKYNSGLFFIADGNTELLEKALQLLQYEGIGTDRNVGNGFFEYEKASIEIDIPDNADFALCLSTFIPVSQDELKDMLNSDQVAYDFQRRGGWITTPPHNSIRKNVIYAFTAGSVFYQHIDVLVSKGRVDIDLKPSLNFETINHHVWRCGRALFLPIKVK